MFNYLVRNSLDKEKAGSNKNSQYISIILG